MSGENYHLIIRKGPKPGQIYPLLAPNITIGRDPMSDISLNDPEVSRYHAQLVQTDVGYQIQDMGSTNGTYVAGQRLAGEPVPLTPGVEVAFGSGITLTYETTGGDDDPALATMVDYADAARPKPETAVPQMGSPPPSPGYNPEPAQPFVPGVEDDGKKKRTTTIVISIILILLLCCCGFIAFMWYYGGDWILQQLDLAMGMPAVQSLLA